MAIDDKKVKRVEKNVQEGQNLTVTSSSPESPEEKAERLRKTKATTGETVAGAILARDRAKRRNALEEFTQPATKAAALATIIDDLARRARDSRLAGMGLDFTDSRLYSGPQDGGFEKSTAGSILNTARSAASRDAVYNDVFQQSLRKSGIAGKDLSLARYSNLVRKAEREASDARAAYSRELEHERALAYDAWRKSDAGKANQAYHDRVGKAKAERLAKEEQRIQAKEKKAWEDHKAWVKSHNDKWSTREADRQKALDVINSAVESGDMTKQAAQAARERLEQPDFIWVPHEGRSGIKSEIDRGGKWLDAREQYNPRFDALGRVKISGGDSPDIPTYRDAWVSKPAGRYPTDIQAPRGALPPMTEVESGSGLADQFLRANEARGANYYDALNSVSSNSAQARDEAALLAEDFGSRQLYGGGSTPGTFRVGGGNANRIGLPRDNRIFDLIAKAFNY